MISLQKQRLLELLRTFHNFKNQLFILMADRALSNVGPDWAQSPQSPFYSDWTKYPPTEIPDLSLIKKQNVPIAEC
jgi:hypothetical protein